MNQIKEEAHHGNQEANRIYRRKQRSGRVWYGIGLVLLIYLGFFCSNWILPQQLTPADAVTRPGEARSFAENRSVRLLRATYSPEQEVMEILLQFTNENYDNVEDYYYALELAGAKAKGLQVEPIFHEPLVTVLRIEHLPRSYQELQLYVAPKTVPMEQVTDAITGTLTLNRYNVTEGRINRRKTRTGYLKERLDSVIADYERIQKRQERVQADYETKIAALEAENQEILENRRYRTDAESRKKEEIRLDNEEQISELRELVKQQEQKVEATRREIQNAMKKRQSLHP